MYKYCIIALIGKAGSGKDTLLKELLKVEPKLRSIVSYTTRPPRQGELDGIDYHFVSGEVFAAKLLNEELLEASFFNDWFYGTGYDSLKPGAIHVGVFNPDGVDSLKAHKDILTVVYYLDVKDKERLLRQLNREDDPDVNEIIRRFKADEVDFDEIDFSYNLLVNDNTEDLRENLKIITSDLALFESKIG
jgi:guanylate kinase